jgi:hypothetical protein
MTARRLCAVGLAVLLVAPAAAQVPPRTPPRDPSGPAQPGTSVVRGRVFAADTKRPLRRARIQLNAPELRGENRTTSTNADGRYEFKDLPAGRYTITVTRSGYLRLTYGQRRPFEQGKPLQVGEKQTLDDVDFTLPRMSVISGRVVDETGDAISGVRMFPMRVMYFEGRRRVVPAGPLATTDDTGQYRILGLMPGQYFVSADLRETWTVTEGGVDRIMGYAPTYFPGTTIFSNAGVVSVGTGAETGSIDFALIPGRAANVSGFAFDSQGRPLAGRRVGVSQEYRGPGGAFMMGTNAGVTIGADGAFLVRDLAPGDYKLRVQSSTNVGATTVEERVIVPITVDGIDLDNVNLTATAGWSIAGEVLGEDGLRPSMPRDRALITARMVDSDLAYSANPTGADNGRPQEDWAFSINSVYGAARLRATLPDGWRLKAILQDGRDVTDTVFEMRTGEVLSGIQVIVSDRVNRLSGEITNDNGVALPDGTLLVFADDPAKWTQDSRFVRAARPDQQGRYEIRGLPAGSYLAVALDYIEDGMWNDPEFLQSLRDLAERVTIAEVGTHSLSLKLIAPPGI